MDAEGGDPPHRLPPSECPALAGADSPRDPEEGKPASPPSADTPEGYPPDRTETVKTPPSAEKMVGLPDCPPETTLQGDEQKLDDLDSCGAANRSPQSQPLWGEALSRLPKPPIYHRDSNSGVSHRREPQDPGLHRLAEKAGSVDSSSIPSYWGEIETEPEPSDSLSRATKLMYHPVSGKQRPTALKGSTPNGDGALDSEPSHWDSGQPEESDPALLAMFHAVANSRLAVKSQQKDEPDFTPAEKLAILRDLYHTKPLVFLERFRKALHEEHLPCFRHISGSYEADFYCAEVRRASLGKTQHTRVRNKRYAALQQLIRGGEYFSDEQMRSRDPLLYEQYIGQYLSDEELQVLGSCKLEASCPLSGVLLDSYQEQVIQRRLQIQQEQEEACGEEDEESDSDVDEAEALDSEMEECALDEEEKALLREEFTSRMYQRFLDGKDRDFNYSEVDENPDFDNLDIVSRDEEERYFDGEDPEDADAMDEE